MKIAIIGTHKTGKTTTLDSLNDGFEKFHVIPEIIQDFNFQTSSFFEYMRIQEEVLLKQIVIENLYDNTISDRSTIDNLAYMVVRFMKAFPQYDVETALRKIFDLSPSVVSSAIKNFTSYNLLFYTPIEFITGSPTDNEITYQKNIDSVIKFLLKSYQLESIYLTGSTEKRKESIIEVFDLVKVYYDI